MMRPDPTMSEDPRSFLDKMRRTQLARFLSGHNIPHPPGATANTMRALIMDKGMTGRELPPRKGERPPVEITPDYEGMNMPSLRRACAERGLKQQPTDKAVDLRRKLLDHDASNRR